MLYKHSRGSVRLERVATVSDSNGVSSVKFTGAFNIQSFNIQHFSQSTKQPLLSDYSSCRTMRPVTMETFSEIVRLHKHEMLKCLHQARIELKRRYLEYKGSIVYIRSRTHRHQLFLAARELEPSAHHTQAVNVCCSNSKSLQLGLLQFHGELRKAINFKYRTRSRTN